MDICRPYTAPVSFGKYIEKARIQGAWWYEVTLCVSRSAPDKTRLFMLHGLHLPAAQREHHSTSVVTLLAIRLSAPWICLTNQSQPSVNINDCSYVEQCVSAFASLSNLCPSIAHCRNEL